MQTRTPRFKRLIVAAALVVALAFMIYDQVNSDSIAARAFESITLTAEQFEEAVRSSGEVSALITGDAAQSQNSRQRLWDRIANVKTVHAQGADPSATPSPTPTRVPEIYELQLQQLTARWTPRYEQAMSDLTKFEKRFDTADALVADYFAEQSKLTESIANLEIRAEQARIDRMERATYQRWLTQGRSLLIEVAQMKRDLQDMNTVIEKQQLRVEFLAENSGLNQIPQSAQLLHDALGEFKAESDSLAATLQAEFSK